MYNYQTERPKLFTESGSVMFLKFRDRVKNLLQVSGAVTAERAMEGLACDTWVRLACVDRLVELGEIREVTDPGKVAGQYRVFVGSEP